MTISSSLNAGVAGLNANASRLATISDNIANSSTFGYRRVESNFESMVMAQNGGTYSAGGVRATTQRLIDQGGSLISTSNPTDLAVSGRGFLPVAQLSQVTAGNDSPEMLLTSTGSFRTDAEGRLVTQSGQVLLGWPANPDGTIPNFPRDTTNALEPVRISTNQLSGEPTTRVNLGVNLPATATDPGATGTPQQLSVEYFDNLGRSETLGVTFTPGSSNQWTMTLTDSAQPGVEIGKYALTFRDDRDDGGTLVAPDPAAIPPVIPVENIGAGTTYDPATGRLTVQVASGDMEVNIGRPGASDGLTQLSDRFAPLSISKDGTAVGSMTSAEVDENGFVRAFFDTGATKVIAQVPLVDVPNPNGMMSFDAQTYKPSMDSGAFFLWNAGEGPTGEIAGFARQESATDVAGELTSMIQTQRAYSSNAKVIQTVNEMLQETTNIIR